MGSKTVYLQPIVQELVEALGQKVGDIKTYVNAAGSNDSEDIKFIDENEYIIEVGRSNNLNPSNGVEFYSLTSVIKGSLTIECELKSQTGLGGKLFGVGLINKTTSSLLSGDTTGISLSDTEYTTYRFELTGILPNNIYGIRCGSNVPSTASKVYAYIKNIKFIYKELSFDEMQGEQFKDNNLTPIND